MTQRINMHVSDEFADVIKRHKPQSLSLAAFCAYLIEQALDTVDKGLRVPAYCVGAGHQVTTALSQTNQPPQTTEETSAAPSGAQSTVSVLSSSPAEEEKTFPVGSSVSIGEGVGTGSGEGKRKTLVWKKEIPPSLDCHSDLIQQFWETKAGAKSKQAWSLLMTELGKIQERYGDRPLRDQLELAAANRWKSVTLKNYEQFGLNKPPARDAGIDFDALDKIKMPW